MTYNDKLLDIISELIADALNNGEDPKLLVKLLETAFTKQEIADTFLLTEEGVL